VPDHSTDWVRGQSGICNYE